MTRNLYTFCYDKWLLLPAHRKADVGLLCIQDILDGEVIWGLWALEVELERLVQLVLLVKFDESSGKPPDVQVSYSNTQSMQWLN